jgi:hypothetical protein
MAADLNDPRYALEQCKEGGIYFEREQANEIARKILKESSNRKDPTKNFDEIAANQLKDANEKLMAPSISEMRNNRYRAFIGAALTPIPGKVTLGIRNEPLRDYVEFDIIHEYAKKEGLDPKFSDETPLELSEPIRKSHESDFEFLARQKNYLAVYATINKLRQLAFGHPVRSMDEITRTGAKNSSERFLKFLERVTYDRVAQDGTIDPSSRREIDPESDGKTPRYAQNLAEQKAFVEQRFRKQQQEYLAKMGNPEKIEDHLKEIVLPKTVTQLEAMMQVMAPDLAPKERRPSIAEPQSGEGQCQKGQEDSSPITGSCVQDALAVADEVSKDSDPRIEILTNNPLFKSGSCLNHTGLKPTELFQEYYADANDQPSFVAETQRATLEDIKSIHSNSIFNNIENNRRIIRYLNTGNVRID